MNASEKLGKLIPLLSSDKDGEVLAAVAAIGRTLRAAGLEEAGKRPASNGDRRAA